MSKEALLSLIDQKADEQAVEIVSSAEEAAKNRLKKVEAELAAEYERRLGEVVAQLEQTVQGQKTLLRIDGKKAELSAKRALIDDVYRMAESKILSMSDEEYLEFVKRLISKFAEEGDEVIIAKSDERRITANWLADCAFNLQISLKFSSDRHSMSGGVILRSAKYDKNLTVPALMDEAKRSTESYVVESLFG